jgi:hypothetical protein
MIYLLQKCDAELYGLTVDEALNLTIDIAILRGSKENFLIHLSGTHGLSMRSSTHFLTSLSAGVEAYSGSSTQVRGAI